MDASLDQRRFVRIHRSAVANVDVVNERRQDADGDVSEDVDVVQVAFRQVQGKSTNSPVDHDVNFSRRNHTLLS
jgi:hypothetical protein